MSTFEILVVIGLTAAGSIVHGSIGIGLGLVAAPALVAIDPAFTPGPLLLVAQIVGIRHIVAERHTADIAAWKRSMIGVPVGIIGAIVVLELVSDKWLAIVVGSLTAMAASMLLLGLNLSRSPRAETVAGAVCAVLLSDRCAAGAAAGVRLQRHETLDDETDRIHADLVGHFRRIRDAAAQRELRLSRRWASVVVVARGDYWTDRIALGSTSP